MGSLAGDGFIGALLPASAEPEWVRADGSMKDTEEVGCWPTPSKIENRKRNENPVFSSERENKESFLLEIFRDRDSCQ